LKSLVHKNVYRYTYLVTLVVRFLDIKFACFTAIPIQVTFVYEGHRVKVKVTGAKKREIAYSRNAKVWWAITPVL